MYKRILVPLDGTSESEQALDHAARMARRFGSRVLLVRVIPPLPENCTLAPCVREQWSGTVSRLALQYLIRVARRLKENGQRVELATAAGPPHQHILRLARERAADLIVMATPKRSRLARLFHHSVAEQVLRSADVPVLLVHSAARQPRRARRKGAAEPVDLVNHQAQIA